jgi:hypothetical protein
MDTTRIFNELRHKIAGSDQFMSGHQLINPRARTGGISRRVPEWTKSDSKVQKLLITSFPHHQTNQLQRERMARWLAVIYYHFRLQMSVGGVAGVAKDRGIKIVDVKGTIKRIRRAGAGLNTAGKQRRPQTNVKAESVKRRVRREIENEELGVMDRILAPARWLPVRRNPVLLVPNLLVPEWLSKKKVYKLIDTSFQKWMSVQHQQAKRWYQIIHYSWRRGASRKEVAGLMGITERQVRYVLKRIRGAGPPTQNINPLDH